MASSPCGVFFFFFRGVYYYCFFFFLGGGIIVVVCCFFLFLRGFIFGCFFKRGFSLLAGVFCWVCFWGVVYRVYFITEEFQK